MSEEGVCTCGHEPPPLCARCWRARLAVALRRRYTTAPQAAHGEASISAGIGLSSPLTQLSQALACVVVGCPAWASGALRSATRLCSGVAVRSNEEDHRKGHSAGPPI